MTPAPAAAPAQEQPIASNIVNRVIEEEMRQSYLDYAMSVIVGRALPDAKDGLKPVHRRILFAMHDMGLKHNTAYKKSARIVGEVLGKYHPHGDQAVYDSLVRMAQDFSLRYLLVNGQGNFGSIDGDNPAAMRYTEVKMSRMSEELLVDIEKETVPFADNFDGSLKEPLVLPSRIPNLLINGSTGIAVGMATNMPPHNLNEISEALIALIDKPDSDSRELSRHITGPDFPTGGIIQGTAGIQQAYLTGRGKIRVKAVIAEEQNERRKRLVITEIPYMVNKSMLIEQIANAVRDKLIEGISDIRDESDRQGMRIVIELKQDASSEIVTNQLFKHSRCQETFSINNLALVDGQPKTLSLKELLQIFLTHRQDVIRRRTAFDLGKAKAKEHILEGLVKALEHIDAIIAIIRKSPTVVEAQNGLMKGYALSEEQSKAILDMKLSRLASLEQQKIKDDLAEVRKLIIELESILADELKILGIIKAETRELMAKYGDVRKTRVMDGGDEADIDIEDLIEPEDVIVTISTAGYVKRTGIDTYKSQRRGGKGVIAATTKEDDVLNHLFVANTHHQLLVFTSHGQVYWIKVYRIPDSGRYSKGTALVNLLQMEKDERVSAVIPVKEFDDVHFLTFITTQGTIKKTTLDAYSRPRQGGIIAINLNEKDEVVDVLKTDGDKQLLIATAKGMAVKFHETDVRPMGRNSTGVRAIRLASDDRVIGMVAASDDDSLATITENGYGKRTRIADYRLISRGGKGVKNIICSPRNGDVVCVMRVTDQDDLLFITASGIAIRTPAKDISVIGRNTQGVRLMKLEGNDKIASAAKVIREENGETEKPVEVKEV
jgi:DNA gyrase subunit A